jgi:hypothetical protein
VSLGFLDLDSGFREPRSGFIDVASNLVDLNFGIAGAVVDGRFGGLDPWPIRYLHELGAERVVGTCYPYSKIAVPMFGAEHHKDYPPFDGIVLTPNYNI